MPSNVAWFERLMYLQLALGIGLSATEWNMIVSKAPDASVLTHMFAVAGSELGIVVFLIWQTARKRQNWARWVLLILALVVLPFFLRMLVELRSENPFAWEVRIAQLAMEIVAFILIFTGNAREWFNPDSSIAGANPGSPIQPQL